MPLEISGHLPKLKKVHLREIKAKIVALQS
jgi:hypothetical protein